MGVGEGQGARLADSAGTAEQQPPPPATRYLPADRNTHTRPLAFLRATELSA